MVMERSRCREEELTRNYIKLVFASEMGQGIMPDTVRESEGISFVKLSGNRGLTYVDMSALGKAFDSQLLGHLYRFKMIYLHLYRECCRVHN